jgi:hypothetical protein
MAEPFKFDQSKRVGSGWNLNRLHVGKRLTDRKINEYQRAGFYDSFKGTRREREQELRRWRAKHGI